MRTFEELDQAEKEQAFDLFTNKLLGELITGMFRFNPDIHGDLQEAIDGAMEQAERLQTPWFAHEYIVDAEYSGGKVIDTLRDMAKCDASEAFYLRGNEYAVHLPSARII